MVTYREVNKVDGALISKAIIPVLDTRPQRGKKITARKKISEQVFGLDDSVADNAKLIAVLTNCVSEMYRVMPSGTKAKLSNEAKEILEVISENYDFSKTIVGKKASKQGFVETIKALFGRQEKIAEIVG